MGGLDTTQAAPETGIAFAGAGLVGAAGWWCGCNAINALFSAKALSVSPL
jgi:hypothetical protein